MISLEGPCSLPLQGMAELIAACPTFQSRVGCGTHLAALQRVHIGKVDFTSDPPPTRPYAIVTDDDLATWEMDRYFKSAGQVVVTFELLSDPLLDPDSPDSLKDFTNAVGKILIEMFERSNTPAPGGEHYWNAVKATRLIAPDLVDLRKCEDPNEPGELFFEVAFLIDWT